MQQPFARFTRDPDHVVAFARCHIDCIFFIVRTPGNNGVHNAGVIGLPRISGAAHQDPGAFLRNPAFLLARRVCEE